ncbi:efflux RND transporter periplasmic adaptor subunit [Adhaeribacter pallidiroseus]|uniref:Multidrug resistance protein MexA n=1 Tax=Adhaeribacter pallidiroseus TaxID=2072847 RepID=A0A369QFX0_9BACT|nr:efflux RND transporter periplasmic adaptor subunit [Adhaeribacter pallidiroseus]RDC63594.1 Multidrug resistance protein MexA [Adhaeribacter pallidiroseus]
MKKTQNFNYTRPSYFLGIIAALILSACGAKEVAQTPPPVPSLPVLSLQANAVTTYQEYPATVEGLTTIEIRPQVNGYLEQVYVDEGAYVQKGQALFKINELPYKEQLNTALAGLHAAEAELINAQLEIDKLTPLVQNKVVSDIQLKTANAAYSLAKARVEQGKAAVAAANINLGYTVVKAPVSGYVGRLLRKQGSLVAPTDAQALTEVSDVHEVHVYFSLGEQDFNNFKNQYPGQNLAEKLRLLPPVDLVLTGQNTFANQGKIDMVDGQFDKNTGAITVRATFPNAEGFLRSGNTGKIRLSRNHTNTILVPTSATVELQDKVFVFAVGDSNKVARQAIQIAGKSGSAYLVKEGLKIGDRIVLNGFDHLQEGQIIQPEKSVPDSLNRTTFIR